VSTAAELGDLAQDLVVFHRAQMLETMVGNGRKARPPTIFCPTREWRSRVVRAPSLGESLVFSWIFPPQPANEVIALKSSQASRSPPWRAGGWNKTGGNDQMVDTLSNVVDPTRPDRRQPARHGRFRRRARSCCRRFQQVFNSVLKSGLLSGIILHNWGNTGLSSTIHSCMCGAFSRLIATRFRKFGGKHSTQAILTLAPLDPDGRLHCELGLL
jgi:hypothetical protein